MGLLVPKHPATTARTNYATVRKNLNLIVDEVNEQDPDDVAYVYNGYAPLSIRLVQCVVQKDALGLAARRVKAMSVGVVVGEGLKKRSGVWVERLLMKYKAVKTRQSRHEVSCSR